MHAIEVSRKSPVAAMTLLQLLMLPTRILRCLVISIDDTKSLSGHLVDVQDFWKWHSCMIIGYSDRRLRMLPPPPCRAVALAIIFVSEMERHVYLEKILNSRERQVHEIPGEGFSIVRIRRIGRSGP